MKRSIFPIIAGIMLSSPALLAQYQGGYGSGYSSESSSAGWASEATSQITASPTSIVADGISTSTITVQLKDASSNNLTIGGDIVLINTSLGTLGSVSDNGNGTYTATLTSGTVTGTATVTGTVNSSTITDDAAIEFIAGTASKLEFVQQPSNTNVGTTITPPVTVQIKDINGNDVASSDIVVQMTLSYGSGTLLGTDSVLTNENGLAVFSDLQIDSSGQKVLTALSDGLTSMSSYTFLIHQSSVSLSLVQLWNMVSVPLIQTNDSVSAIFPEAIGSIVYGFASQIGYIPITNPELGRGYWLNYPNADTIMINGDVPEALTVSAKLGWNIIGSRNVPMELSSLVLSGGNTIVGDIAYYYVNGIGYVPITVLNPGQGAWINIEGSSADCTITMPE